MVVPKLHSVVAESEVVQVKSKPLVVIFDWITAEVRIILPDWIISAESRGKIW